MNELIGDWSDVDRGWHGWTCKLCGSRFDHVCDSEQDDGLILSEYGCDNYDCEGGYWFEFDPDCEACSTNETFTHSKECRVMAKFKRINGTSKP